MNGPKMAYTNKAMATATAVAALLPQLKDLVDVWDDRQYGPGAANELTAEDIGVQVGETTVPIVAPNDLYALIIFCSQVQKFVEADPAAVPGPYSATVNRLRKDM